MHSKCQHHVKDTDELDTSHLTMQKHYMSSDFDNIFTEFTSAELIAMYKCVSCLVQIDEDVNDTASRLESFFHLDIAAQENETLCLQNDNQMKYRASGEQGYFL